MATAPRNDREAKIAAARGPQRNNRKAILAAVVGLLVVGAVILAMQLGNRSESPAPSPSGGSNQAVALPKTVKDATAPVVASAGGVVKDGVPTLMIFEDFQCPACKQAEELFGDKITELGASGKLNVVVYTKTFMNDNLRNDSSTKVGNAAMCAADAGAFGAYRQKVFAKQPAEGGAGYPDGDVQAAATEAGLSGAGLETWKTCVADQKYLPYLQGIERHTAEKMGITGTPAFYVNGKKVDLQGIASAEDFEKKLFETAK